MLKRPRRLRGSSEIRKLVRETKVTVDDLIYPLFIVEGKGIKTEVPSMPGVFHMSIDMFLIELEEVQRLGINGVLLFGVPDTKDEAGT